MNAKLCILLCLATSTARASDIVFDGSVGAPGALSPTGSEYLITPERGLLAGGNLFHSFSQFDIGAGETATFTGDGVQNVIGRVTGGQASHIDGTLRSTIPGADLYLLNPFGVLFGEQSQIDLAGGLYLGAADYVRFADGGRLYAQLGQASSFSSAAPAAFGFLPEHAGGLVSASGAWLITREGEGLTLVGRQVTVSSTAEYGAYLHAPGAALQIAAGVDGEVPVADVAQASLSDFGQITLDNAVLKGVGGQAGSISLVGDVQARDGTTLETGDSNGGGGPVFIRGGQFFMDNSRIQAASSGAAAGSIDIVADAAIRLDGSELFSTTGDTPGGDVGLRGESIEMTGSTLNTDSTGGGQSGAIVLVGGSLVSLQGDSVVKTQTRTDTATPAVVAVSAATVDVTDASLLGDGPLAVSAQAFRVGPQGIVSGAPLSVRADSVNVDGARVSSAGNLDIQADQVAVGGGGRVEAASLILSVGGDVTLSGGKLLSTGALILQAQRLGVQDGSIQGTSVSLRADQISVSGELRISSNAPASVQAGSVKVDGGDIAAGGGLWLEAERVTVSGGGRVEATPLGLHVSGELVLDGGVLVSAGALQLQAQRLSVRGGAAQGAPLSVQASEVTLTQGVLQVSGGGLSLCAERLFIQGGAVASIDGGDIEICATESVDIAGKHALDDGSGVISLAQGGQGGKISVTTPLLRVSQGGLIISEAQETGDGGEIRLNVQDLQVSGGGQVRADNFGAGQGGNIDIQAGQQVTLEEGARPGLQSSARGAGPGGNIRMTAPRVILREGGKMASEAIGAGNAGNIDLYVDTLELRDGALISTSSLAAGAGGRLSVRAEDGITLQGTARLASNAVSAGPGGHIVLQAPTVRLSDGAEIQAGTVGGGDAGEVVITARQLELVDGARITAQSCDLDHCGASARSAVGRGGKVSVAADAVLIAGTGEDGIPSGISSSAYGYNRGGEIEIRAGRIVLDRRGTLQTQGLADGDAGEIRVEAGELAVLRGADIDSSNEGTGSGRGGDIVLSVAGTVEIGAEQTDTSAYPGAVKAGYMGGIYSIAQNQGGGGDIRLSAARLAMHDGGTISSSSEGAGRGGEIGVTLAHALSMDNAAILSQATQAQGGGILIERPENVVLIAGSQISVTSEGAGNAGDIALRMGRGYLEDSAITARAEQARGGNILLEADDWLEAWRGQISARAAGLDRSDRGGNVSIRGPKFLVLGSCRVEANAKGGDGGNILLQAEQFVPSGDSVLDASSELGVDGEVLINAPDTGLEGGLTLAPRFLDTQALANNLCRGIRAAEISSFTLSLYRGSPATPDDWQNSPPPPEFFEER